MEINNKRLLIITIAFIAMIIAISITNHWISQNIKITQKPVVEKPILQQPAPVQETAKKHHVTIDPNNDPLAPVIPRKQSKAQTKKSPAKPLSAEKIYEPSLDNVILAQ